MMEDTWYCPECDCSYRESEMVIIPHDAFGEQFGCPDGHVYPKVYLNNYFYELGMYLLNASDEDTFPYVRWMPSYSYD